MAIDIVAPMLEFLAAYGLYAVFVLLVLDGALLLPVLPGEIVMVMAVAAYANNLWDLAMLVLLATAAAIVGSLMLYGFSRWGGRSLIERHPRLFMMPRRRRERLERAFQHPLGQSLVLFLRIVPLTRVLVNIPAGLARMRVIPFVILSSIGMLVFHAGFMYITFVYGEPGAGVGEQAAALQQAYGSPAWEFIQANEVITALGALAFGAFLSFRASRRVLKWPDEPYGSLLGRLSVRMQLWGGLAVLALIAYDPALLFELSRLGGLDIEQLAGNLRWEPASFVAGLAGIATLLGIILIALEKTAKHRHEQWKEQQRLDEVEEAQVEALPEETDDGDAPVFEWADG